MAAAVATPPRPPKRKAGSAIDTATPSPLPISKRARYEASSKTDEAKVWEGIAQDMEAESPDDAYSTPNSPAPSLPFTEGASIPETSATSTSKRAKKFPCEVPECGKAFDRPARLQIHMRSHTNERPYTCSEDGCDKTFLRAEHMKRHIQDKHRDERNYTCDYILRTNEEGTQITCGKSYTTATKLKRHVAAHEAKEETRCTYAGCGKVFRKQETLQRHIKTDHLHEKAYKCTHVEMDSQGQPVECEQAFSKPKQLKNHVAREHEGVRYFCEICSPESVDGDLMEADPEMASLMSDITRVGFPTYADLQHHLRTVHPPACPDCGKECESNRALKAHMEIEHSALSERQTHLCTWPDCGRGFTKAGNLKVHMQSVHMKQRGFVCGEFDLTGNVKVEGWNGVGCGSKFGTKANLEEHVRTQHLGLKSKIKPCRLKKKMATAEEESLTPESAMDVDEIVTPADFDAGNGTLSMLTGVGYDSRDIGCLIEGCPRRFRRNYDLAEHLELTHGWNADDINERLAEKSAIESEQFWVGGVEQAEVDEVGMQRDEELRRSLTEVLAEQHNVGEVVRFPGFGEVEELMEVQTWEGDDEVLRRQVDGLREATMHGSEKMIGKKVLVGAGGLFPVGAVNAMQMQRMAIDPALVES